MKIYHLNCSSFCPQCQKLWQGSGSWVAPAHMVCHCLAIETEEGIILVDSGFGVQDVMNPSHLGRMVKTLLRPQLKLEETALFQLDRLGFNRRDVRHIILTHLDFDHAGGIADFPMAHIHASSPEINAALAPRSVMEKMRYRARQFAHDPKWTATLHSNEAWFNFSRVQRLKGIEQDIALVPLPGHSRGHCGVAVKNQQGKWLFHVGDLYMDRRTLLDNSAPYALQKAEQLMACDNLQRMDSLQQVRQLLAQHGDQVEVFCSHDLSELAPYVQPARHPAA